MNAQELCKRLRQDRNAWRSTTEGPELRWTLRGIDSMRRVVHALIKEERAHQAQRTPRLHRWLAGDLFRAVNQALTYLGRGDRRKAIVVLEKARDAVQVRRTCAPDKNGPFKSPANIVS